MKQSIVSPSRRGLASLVAAAAFAVAGFTGIAVAHADPVTLTAKLVPCAGRAADRPRRGRGDL